MLIMETKQNTLDKIRSRPRFKIFISSTAQEYQQQLKKLLYKYDKQFGGNINNEVSNIWVKTSEFPFWKPYLSLRTEIENEKTVVRGIFGPSSSVWTFFMFVYFLLTVLWMVFITIWFVSWQIKAEGYTWGLPASMIVLACILLTYLSSLYGQKKAKQEIDLLRKFALESSDLVDNCE